MIMLLSMNIGVLGGGSFGIAIALHLARKGHTLYVWEIDRERVEYIRKTKKHDLLPHVTIPHSVTISSDISIIKESTIIIVAVPSSTVVTSCQNAEKYLTNDAVIVCSSKGFDQEKNQLLTDAINDVVHRPVAVLSGPSFAREVAEGKVTGIVIASEDESLNQQLKTLFSSENMIVETSTDPRGVQLAAAFKNIIAIGVGMVNGMGEENNAEALMITKGFRDLVTFGIALGGKEETLYGLAGLGDVILTCMRSQSRNRTFGELLGQGMAKARALSEIGMVVEGLAAITIVKDLCRQYKLSLPVVDAIHAVIEQGKDPKTILQALV
jgi:glycerol-3-phosphate dehydrogenase (NAD(P)+)